MALILPPPPREKIEENHKWREWFFNVYSQIVTNTVNTFNGLSFISSNITSIVTRNHNDLTIIQGGSTTERYHLTSAQQVTVAALPVVTGLGVAGMTTALTVGVAGTATAPPLPVGYMIVSINGTNYKIPYYNV